MRKRVYGVALLVWMSGLLLGAVFGPQLHVLYWSKILDWYPDVAIKNRACLHLKDSEIGKESLRSRLESPKKTIRDLSVVALAYFDSPDAVVFLFDRVPAVRVDERMDIVRGLSDFPRQYSVVLKYLHTELRNEKNSPRVRTEISDLLRSINKAEVQELRLH